MKIFKNEKIQKRIIIAGNIIGVLVPTVLSPILLTGAWKGMDDFKPSSIFVLASVGGFLGGMAYILVFAYIEFLIKKLWAKYKTKNTIGN